jgi:hypothetical protein
LWNEVMRIVLVCDMHTGIDFMIIQLNWIHIQNILDLDRIKFKQIIKLRLMTHCLAWPPLTNHNYHKYTTRAMHDVDITHVCETMTQNLYFLRIFLRNTLYTSVNLLSVHRFKLDGRK